MTPTPEAAQVFTQELLQAPFPGAGTVDGTVDHLDKTLGLGGWQTEVASLDAGALIVTLKVRNGAGVWVSQAGVGTGPPIAAWAEAFLTAARLHGVGRFTQGQAAPTFSATVPAPVAPPAAPPPQAVATTPGVPAVYADVPFQSAPPQNCPVHGIPFSLQAGGVSKRTGKPYAAFWKCNGKNPDGSYCQQKPG